MIKLISLRGLAILIVLFFQFEGYSATTINLNMDEQINYFTIQNPTGSNTTDAFTVESVKNLIQKIEKDRIILKHTESTFVLDNNGGKNQGTEPLAVEILNLAKLIKAKTGYPLVVIVVNSCASMCIATFFDILNLSRTNSEVIVKIKRDAYLGFHAASIMGFIVPMGLEMYFNSLIQNGVNETWITKRWKLFSTLKITWIQPHDLIVENIGQLSPTDVID